MTSTKFLLSAFAVLATATVSPGEAGAQHRGTSLQQSEHAQQLNDLRGRFGHTNQRIADALASRAISRSRAVQLRRQVARTEQDMMRTERRRGVVSAAQIASFNRTLGAIDSELDRRGVARHYGNDGIVAPGHGYGNDGLPSAEVSAFQRADARLRYRNARIEYDANNCAVYQGIARDGRVRREPLQSASGKSICARR